MRFFHKFNSLNYVFYGLVNGIMLNVKKKTKYTRSLEYLKKYSYVLDDIKMLEPSDKYPNKIWQCWFQGKENLPPIVKKCTETVQKFHGDRVIFLDNNNISDFVEFPDYIMDKHKKGIISYANLSDMLRLSLIAKYGGTWVDSTIYLTDKIPDEILNADFFSFKTMKGGILKDINSLDEFCMYNNYFNTNISLESSYFLSAKPANEIINGTLNLFFEYWKHEDSIIDYLLIDRCFALAVLNNREYIEKFLKIPTYYVENIQLLQEALFERYDENLFNMIKSITPIHKLTHKNLHRNHYKDSFLNTILEKDII